jgi:hypothetical protein
MNPETLLRELEPLTHGARMRRMVEVGLQATTDSEVAAAIHALEQRGPYERRLALQSCYGSRDGAHVLRAVADSYHAIRGQAIVLAPLA